MIVIQWHSLFTITYFTLHCYRFRIGLMREQFIALGLPLWTHLQTWSGCFYLARNSKICPVYHFLESVEKQHPGVFAHPKIYNKTLFTMILYNSENSICGIRPFSHPLFCHSSVVNHTVRHLSCSSDSEPVMRLASLDYKILLQSPPLTLLAESAPVGNRSI